MEPDEEQKMEEEKRAEEDAKVEPGKQEVASDGAKGSSSSGKGNGKGTKGGKGKRRAEGEEHNTEEAAVPGSEKQGKYQYNYYKNDHRIGMKKAQWTAIWQFRRRTLFSV